MMDETVAQKETPNSVKISINAKGFWSGEVKAYAEDVVVAYDLALAKSLELEALIKEKNGGSDE